jgi:ferritin-like metal-binding protein YciE
MSNLVDRAKSRVLDRIESSHMSDILDKAKVRVIDRIESPKDLLKFKLGAALKMENTVLEMLYKLRDEARSDELKHLFRHHADETRGQIDNIVQAFAMLGTDADEKPCPTIEAIDKESKANMKIASEQMLDAVILSGAAETEHHEIAVYEALIILTEELGEHDVVTRLRENLGQEQHTLEEVTRAMHTAVQALSHQTG